MRKPIVNDWDREPSAHEVQEAAVFVRKLMLSLGATTIDQAVSEIERLRHAVGDR